MDEAYNEGPVSDILIIGLTDKEGVRRSFENRDEVIKTVIKGLEKNGLIKAR